MSSSEFMCLENMVDVLRRVEDDVGGDVMRSGNGPDPKQIVYEIMSDLAQDPNFARESVDDLNSLTCEAVVRYYADSGAVRVVDTTIPPEPEPETVDRRKSPSTVQTKRAQEPESTTPFSTNNQIQSPVTSRQCISIDGQDRDVVLNPDRYSFPSQFAEPLRSIVDIRVSSVVLPASHHTVNCPYLLLTFNEISGSYSHNASDPVRKAFTKLVHRSSYSSQGGRSYLVMEPAADDARSFSPRMPSLSRLTFRLHHPSGAIVSSARDDVGVTKVTQGSDGNWVIETAKFWHVDDFAAGDLVAFKNFVTGIEAFDRFMERREGHRVVSVGRVDDIINTCNVFLISRAGVLNDSTGIYDPDPRMAEVFDQSHMDSEKAGQINVRASLINMSAQVSISIVATCEQSSRHASEIT